MEVWDPNDEIPRSQKGWGWVTAVTILILLVLLATWTSLASADPVTDEYGNLGLTDEELAVEPPAETLPAPDGEALMHPPIERGVTPPPLEEEDDEREATDPWWRNRISPPRVWSADSGQEVPNPPPNPQPHPECTGVCA